MDELTLTVRGIDFPNADRTGTSRRMEAMLCVPGEPVELRPEPGNRADEHAVAVFSARGVQIGYVAAERAPLIGGRLKRGDTMAAVFQGMTAGNAFVRVRLGGGLPSLPAASIGHAATTRAPDDRFFPDPEPPEWGA